MQSLNSVRFPSVDCPEFINSLRPNLFRPNCNSHDSIDYLELAVVYSIQTDLPQTLGSNGRSKTTLGNYHGNQVANAGE